jgi:outer membrane protein insertion porin family
MRIIFTKIINVYNLSGDMSLQWMQRRLRMLLMVLAGLSAFSCSNLRYLEEGQKLYTGSGVSFESEYRISEKSKLKNELEQVMRPEPNGTFLGMRPRLWFYNIAGEPTGKGLRHFLRNRIGRPPVLFREVDPSRTARLMENRLMNMGYFNASASYDIQSKSQKASVVYTVTVEKPYTFSTLHPVEGNDSLEIIINESLDKNLISEGDPYRLSLLKAERERIDGLLKKRGFFYFHPEVIFFGPTLL